MPNDTELENLHRILVNVNDLRKAAIPGDVNEIKRRIAHLEKMLAEAQDYRIRNENALSMAEEEIRRASELSGYDAIQKLKKIMPRRDRARKNGGAWKAVANEAADQLKRYRDALMQTTTSTNVTFIMNNATQVAMAKTPKRPMMPRMPFMPRHH